MICEQVYTLGHGILWRVITWDMRDRIARISRSAVITGIMHDF